MKAERAASQAVSFLRYPVSTYGWRRNLGAWAADRNRHHVESSRCLVRRHPSGSETGSVEASMKLSGVDALVPS
jgi:hypothetical protein